jgi:hypothetical protein
MCKNSMRYNHTRNFGLCGDAEGKKTEKFVFRSALRPNQISFSHNQDPYLHEGFQLLTSVPDEPTRANHSIPFEIIVSFGLAM